VYPNKARAGGSIISQEKTQLFRTYLRVNFFLKLNARFVAMNHTNLTILWISAYLFPFKIKEIN